MSYRFIAGFLFTAATLANIGCDSGAAGPKVTGSVTYNGAPVENGSITFSPVASGTSFGATIANGKYQCAKAYTGEYQVMVAENNPSAAPSTREEALQSKGDVRSGAGIPENAEGNGQTVEITGGEQTLDFALTGPPRK